MTLNPDQNQTLIEAQHRSLLILWTVLFMSVIGFLVMTLVIRPDATNNFVITIVLMGFSVGNVFLSFRFKGALLRKSVEKQDLQIVLQAYITALAICETAALFAVIIHFVTGSAYYFVAFGVGIVGMLLHFPKKQHLADASFKKL